MAFEIGLGELRGVFHFLLRDAAKGYDVPIHEPLRSAMQDEPDRADSSFVNIPPKTIQVAAPKDLLRAMRASQYPRVDGRAPLKERFARSECPECASQSLTYLEGSADTGAIYLVKCDECGWRDWTA
jgi:predicted RNA-binding Zn-ribbon protein involved in translation (DUF1610 family)